MKRLLILTFISFSLLGSAYPKVKIDTLIDFTKEDSMALDKEIEILQGILENDLFWQKIKEADFGCAHLRDLFFFRKRKADYPKKKRDKHQYSSQEIHDLIWFGDDEIGQPKDGFINLKLQAYDHIQTRREKRKKLVKHGSTNKNTLIIKSNRATRIHAPNRGAYACHLIHEYMHVLGFRHKTKIPSKTTKKCGNVDVALGIQQIARSLL